MNRKRIGGFGALALAGVVVVVLAVTPLGGRGGPPRLAS